MTITDLLANYSTDLIAIAVLVFWSAVLLLGLSLVGYSLSRMGRIFLRLFRSLVWRRPRRT